MTEYLTASQRRFRWRAYRVIRETAKHVSKEDARYFATKLALTMKGH